MLAGNLRRNLEALFQEARDKATSAMLYVLADLTRSPNDLYTNHVVVMWYPCGSRQTAETDREINLKMLRMLRKEGLDIRANSFDAKSRDISVRGKYYTFLNIFN